LSDEPDTLDQAQNKALLRALGSLTQLEDIMAAQFVMLEQLDPETIKMIVEHNRGRK
jgi:hypothetical protein